MVVYFASFFPRIFFQIWGLLSNSSLYFINSINNHCLFKSHLLECLRKANPKSVGVFVCLFSSSRLNNLFLFELQKSISIRYQSKTPFTSAKFPKQQIRKMNIISRLNNTKQKKLRGGETFFPFHNFLYNYAEHNKSKG